MAQDREGEARLLFLEEAQESLDAIESGLLGLGTSGIDSDGLDALLRAAHSIKGGAAMMGFEPLSHLAHRLEDFFKVLQVRKAAVVDEDLERLLLWAVDRLRQVVALNHKGSAIEGAWLETEVNPVFDQLHERLGDLQPEDTATLLSEEAGEDMSVLLFETEVEGCLQRLESVLANKERPCLREEFLIAAQELGGLGEILSLESFSSLCQSVIEQLEAAPEQTEAIARLAIQEWRRSQAMVLTGQVGTLPTQLNLANLDQVAVNCPPTLETDAETFESIESFLESDNFEEEELNLLSLLEAIPESEQLAAKADSFETEVKSIHPLEPSEPQLEDLTTAPASEDSEKTIRVPAGQLERLSDLFGELTIERNGLDLQLKNLRNLIGLLSQRVQMLEQSNFRLRTAYDQIATQGATSSLVGAQDLTPLLTAAVSSNHQLSIPNHQYFDLLEMDRYSDLHLLSGEVMDTIVQIQEMTSDVEINLEDAERTSRELNRTAKQMQTSITKVRMRPISDLVGRFPRALRDMELQYGKQVEFKVKGGSALIDRTILEALGDPLLHLLRNAFDHGIEEPATRRACGKPEKGTIEISAAYRGNKTVITISDDGGGIDLDKIRVRALEMGLDAADLDGASKNDLLNLIFEPGFSTAEQVTDLSGRGVGMDIVRTNLRQVRGEIQVDTKLGMGTTFTISVPFTLSVVRVLLVESNGMLLAFPINAVEEMLSLKPEMVLLDADKKVLNWNGYMMPLIPLSEWLQFPRSHQMVNLEAVPIVNEPTVLMIAQGEELVGIQVERYWGEQEVTIRAIEGSLKMPPGFSGCTILGDGRIVPLVDAIGLLRWIDRQSSIQGSNQVETLPTKSRPNPLFQSPTKAVSTQKNYVMVVDDSITVRRFLALTLEKVGFRVEQAKDGQDALEKLQAGLLVQAVICDIEMPRLDGYGFLAQVKSNSDWQYLPVVMLTSRSSDKHRQLAINLGAQAYFTKPFQEQELLQTLKQLIQK